MLDLRVRLAPLRLAALLAVAVVPPAAAQQDPNLPFQKYTLDNGLEVVLHQDRSVPLAAVSVWYHVGSVDEVPGKTGFAHLFEHMMNRGTQHTGEDRFKEILREIGATSVNASTSPARTNYYEVVPSNQLEVALWLESDRMGYLLPMVTDKSLANQRDVVRNERRQRYDNVPYGRERFALHAALYPEGHPYRYLTIGRHEDIEGASIEDVRAFFRAWYVPSNATLAIAGDFDLDEARRLVQRWFGSFPKAPKPGHRTLPAPELDAPRRLDVPDPFAKLVRLHHAWHSPAFYAPGDAELDLLASALGATGTGRLYKLLVVEKQLAQGVSVYQASAPMSSVFHVIVDLKPEAELATVEALVEAELERVRREPVSERELRRAIVNYEAGFVWGLEDLLARAETLQSYNHYLGDPDGITRDLDRYRKASAQSVQSWASSTLEPARRVTAVTRPAAPGAAEATPTVPAGPEAASVQTPLAEAVAAVATPVPELAFPDEAFRARRPEPGAPRPPVQPSVERFALPNGISVFLVERHELPTVALDLTFEGGSIHDPAGREGLAGLCMGLVDEGTEALEKIAFEEALADLASNVSAWAGAEQQGVSASSLTKHLDRTLDLWADTLRRPGLRAADHERNVQRTVTAIRQAKGAPQSVASRVAGSIVFGPEHPLGRVATESSVEAIGREECAQYVADSLQPDGAQLWVVGDVTRAQLEEKLAPRLAGWTGKPKQGAEPPPPQPREGRLFFVDVPAAEQSSILIGQPGPPRQALDYFPTRIAVSVLGGSSSGRLNMNIREDKGYAYGAGAGIAYSRTFGTLRAGASVRSDVTKEAVLEMFGELRRLASDGIAEAELEREKNAAILGLPAFFATGADVLASFRSLVFYGLPPDYWATYTRNVADVTREAAESAARRHVRPAELRVLVVGDGATVLPGLRELVETNALGPGALVLLDADGQPVAPAATPAPAASEPATKEPA